MPTVKHSGQTYAMLITSPWWWQAVYGNSITSEDVLIPLMGLLLLPGCKNHALVLPDFLLHKLEGAFQGNVDRWKGKVPAGDRLSGWGPAVAWEVKEKPEGSVREASYTEVAVEGLLWLQNLRGLILHGVSKGFPGANQNNLKEKHHVGK